MITSRMVVPLFAAALRLWALEPSDELSHYGRQGWQTSSGLPQNTVRSITQTKDGFLWIATDEGLARFDGYHFTIYNTQNTPALKSNGIEALWTDREGDLQAATTDGVLRYSAGHFAPSRAQAPPKTPAVVMTDSHGVTWTGGDTGLTRTVNGHQERMPSSDPLSAAMVLALYEDREGNLWVGTDGDGLQLLRDQRFTTYTTDQIRCVFQTRDGTVWLGTNGAGLKRVDKENITALTTRDGLSSNVILSLAEDRSGALLAGTPDGLNIIRPGGVKVLTSADGLAEDFIRSVFVDNDGSIWVGTRRGLSHIEGEMVSTYTQSNGLGSDLVGAMARDARGDLWVASLRGLARFRNNAFVNYTTSDGLSSNVITDIHVGADGYLWIATQGGGLNHYKDELFASFGPQQAVPDTIFGVTEDENGSLWLAARNGIFRVAKRDLGAKSNVVAYGTGDGLRVSECSGGGHPAIWRTANNGIWFATARGAAFMSRMDAARHQPAPPVAVETVFVDDNAVGPQALGEVGAGVARLSFEYAGISFASPQRVRYRYKLDGFDRDWIDAATRRTAFYTNLPPRSYVFRVIATNAEGVPSPAAAVLSFSVQPHYYQTWWFRFLVLLALAAAVYGMYAYRVRQVQAKFNAVLQERNRIAREIHDTLAQGFAGVSVQLELVSRLMFSSSEAAKQHLDQARVLVRSCLADARRTIWDLRSGAEDFATRISQLVRQTNSSSGIHVQLQIRGTYRALDPKLEEELLRIAEEALRNAVRHSGASTITVDVAFETRKVRLTVSDDGCGFDRVTVPTQGPEGHFGLEGMKERAEQIQAQFVLKSKQGEGTHIMVEAPVR